MCRRGLTAHDLQCTSARSKCKPATKTAVGASRGAAAYYRVSVQVRHMLSSTQHPTDSVNCNHVVRESGQTHKRPEGVQDCRIMVLGCHTVISQTCLAVLCPALSTAFVRLVGSLGWCVTSPVDMQYVPLECRRVHLLLESELVVSRCCQENELGVTQCCRKQLLLRGTKIGS